MFFSEDMTYPQAVKALFQALENKSDSEKQKIIDEYNKIIPEITKRELKQAEGFLTSYTL